MSTCITCGVYYRTSPYNNSLECDSCLTVENDSSFYDDSDTANEVNLLLSPSGRVRPVFYDDREDDSHGS